MERLSLITKFLLITFLKNPILLGAIIIAILFFLFYILNFFYKEKLTLEDLKLTFDLKLLFLLIPIVIAINSLIFLYRIRNYGNQLNLIELFSKLKNFLLISSLCQIIMTIIMTIIITIMIIMNIILFFLLIKKNTFIFFSKINFYLINYLDTYPEKKESLYEKLKQKYNSYFFKIKKIPRSLFILFFGERYEKTRIFIGNLYPFYGIIILVILFFYDIVYHNYTISKVFIICHMFYYINLVFQ